MLKMSKTKITRNGHSFNVVGAYSKRWFTKIFPRWEASTFKVLERYGGSGGVYLDIGAWIGPTVLYSAHLFNRVIALDADPVALERLDANLAENDFDNITVVKKALSNVNAKSAVFGGNGPLGNSMSTLLVADPEYANLDNKLVSARPKHIVKVPTITIKKMLKEVSVRPSELRLIKMDIEGGELLTVPAMRVFLRKYKTPLYISIHPCFLRNEQVKYIVDMLFDIYEGHCYSSASQRPIDKNYLLNFPRNSVSVVFDIIESDATE